MRFIEKNKKKIDPRYFLNEQTEMLQRNFDDPKENEYFRQVQKVLGADLEPMEIHRIKFTYNRGQPVAYAVKMMQRSREFAKLSPEQQNAKLAQNIEKLDRHVNKPEDPKALARLGKKTVMGAFKNEKPVTNIFPATSDAETQDIYSRIFSGPSNPMDDREPIGAGAKLGQSVSGAGGTVERLPGQRTFSKPATTAPAAPAKAAAPAAPAATTPQPQKKKPVPPQKLKESQDREVSYNKIKNKKNIDLFFALMNYVSTKD